MACVEHKIGVIHIIVVGAVPIPLPGVGVPSVDVDGPAPVGPLVDEALSVGLAAAQSTAQADPRGSCFERIRHGLRIASPLVAVSAGPVPLPSRTPNVLS